MIQYTLVKHMKITKLPFYDIKVKDSIDVSSSLSLFFAFFHLSLSFTPFFLSYCIMSRNNDGKKTPLLTHLVAGGAAGFMEACTCHPLDTIKVRMQLAKNAQRNAAVNIPIPFPLLIEPSPLIAYKYTG